MKQTYRVVSALIALGVIVQAAAIAFGWFDAILQVEDGAVIDENYDGNAGHALHGIVGMNVMPLLGLILLIVSFFAARTVPGARKWGGIVFGLIVLQIALAILTYILSASLIGALHGINALVLFGAAVKAHLLTRTAVGAAGAPQQGTSVAV